MKTVLFICSGNTCRSPLAEAIARQWLQSQGRNEIFVASAGVWAADGMPPTAETVEALRQAGIDQAGRSTALNPEMIRKADIVLCMTQSHLDAVRSLVEGEDIDTRIELVDPDGDVDDPIGQGQPVYDALVKRLQVLLPKRLTELLADEDRSRIRSSR